MKLSVVLSFRNEEATIPELVRRLQLAMQPLPITHEIIFVNDDSTDRSFEMLVEMNARDNRIKIVNMSRNFGNAPCALAGLRHATGDAVLLMDADLQDPPELIPKLVEEFNKGVDVVYTTRTSRAGESAMKMKITAWAYRILRSASSVKLPLDSGDFKLMSRRVVRELLRLGEHDPFLRGMVTWVGFKQTQVFYDRLPRFKGETHFPLLGKGPARAFLAGLTSFSTAPLKLSLYYGVAVSLLSATYLITLLALFAFGWNLPGWTAIVAAILFVGSTQLIMTGVNGIYLGRVYNNAQNRPTYIVERLVGFDSQKEDSKSHSSELTI